MWKIYKILQLHKSKPEQIGRYSVLGQVHKKPKHYEDASPPSVNLRP